WTILMPFEVKIWIYLILLSCAAALYLNLQKKIFSRQQDMLRNISDSWFILSSLVHQGTWQLFKLKSVSLRLFFAFWLFSVAILTYSYSSQLLSFQATSIYESPILTIKDLVHALKTQPIILTTIFPSRVIPGLNESHPVLSPYLHRVLTAESLKEVIERVVA